MPSIPPLSFLPPLLSPLRHRLPPLPRSPSPRLPRRPPARASARPPPPPTPAPGWAVRLLYDGECPLCVREVAFLRRRDGGRGRVDFVDIAAPGYSAARNGGLDYRTAMGRIHALLPDGRVVRDLEVFRRVYDALGLGWLYAPTRLWGLRALADALYARWAAARLRLTGRPPLDQLVAARERRAAAAAGRGGTGGGGEEGSAGEGMRCRMEK